MKNILIAVGAVVALIILFVLWQFVISPLFPSFGQKGKVTVGKQTLSVTVVKTEKDREKGLSGKKSLSDTSGMLFIFDTPDYYSFWMKEMNFPIDIIFINGSKVTTIYKRVPTPSSPSETPPLYKPSFPSDKVLEINAGLSDKYGIKEGDSLTISL
jgi:uncharacterized membrane protein (UPF0127 family)